MSIASRIQAIEQHLEDDYSVLELAGSDLTNVDKNIVNLKQTWKERLLYFINNGTDEVYDNWDKVTGEGTEISLNNTLEAKMKIELKGNTYQEGTPTPTTPIPVQVVSGDNSIEVDNNLFNINNTNIIDAYLSTNEVGRLYKDSYSRNKVAIFEGNYNTTYTIEKTLSARFRVATYNSIVENGQLNNGKNVDSSTSTTILTTSTDKYIYIGYWTYGETLTEQEILDSIKITTSRYQSASYPINLPEGMELCKIGTYQDKIDKSTGKNLFDYSNIVNLAMSDTIDTASNYKGYYIPYTSGETYTISRNTTSNTKNNRFRVAFTYEEPASGVKLYNSEGTRVGFNGAINGDSLLSMSISSNLDFKYIFIYLSNNATTLTTDDVLFMINEGSTALPYEPYGTGWYLKKEIGKVVLNENSNVGVSVSTNYSICYLSDLLDVATTTSSSVGLSNYFKINYNNVIGNAYFTSSKYLYMIMDTSINNSATFKTWLGNNNVSVYYVLATPTYEYITDTTLISQLEALEKGKSYTGQTNLSQTSNDLASVMSATALEEMN